MSGKRLNYCQLLGLNPMKESSYKEDAILKKIESRKTKWLNDSRNKQNDTEQRYKAERLAESADEIRHVMTDPMLRKKEFRDGQIILKGKVQKLRQDCIILTDGTFLILPGTVDNYIKRLHWDGISKKEVLQLAGIREGKPPAAVPPKVKNAFKALRAVDSYTPVEVLNKLITHPNLEINLDALTDGSSNAQIRTAFEFCEKRVNSVRQEVLPDQDSYIQTLRALKLVLDNDKELDTLAAYGRCQRSLAPVMDKIEEEFTGQQLTRRYIDDLLNISLDRSDDLDMALKSMEDFCYKKKIPTNFSDLDSRMVRCPECGSMVPADENTVFCPACGKNFKTVCPSCGTAQKSSNLRCIKCGFDFKEGRRIAESLEMKFKVDIKDGLVTKAAEDLAKLKETYASYAGIAAMEVQLNKSESSLRSLRKIVNDAYSRNRFAECRAACDNFVTKFPEILKDDPEISQKYNDSCTHYNAAELYCQKAGIMDSHEARMECYVSAVENCPDHPLARSKLREHPPQGPADPVGKLGEDRFTMKFEPPADNTGLTYCIFRERNSLPTVTDESRPIAEIPSTVYVDRSLEPGVEYYYSIYSKRWGILSREGVHFGPIIVLADVDTVTIEPIDGGLRLMYEKPRGSTRVRLWRTEDASADGVSTEIALNGETVYDDIGLKGGKKYYYMFVTEYETRNKVERSDGVIYSATPVDAPKPVRDMQIKWNKNDGTYTARWSTDEHVVLYACDKHMVIPGNLVKMEDINTWMKEIKPIQTYNDGMRFDLPDGTVQYIYPIIPRGKMGVKGNDAMIANLRPFRDVEKTLSNRDCVITMIWPPDAIEAKLVISDDEARDLQDLNAEILTVRREEYHQDKSIRIPMGRSRKKCINIFAIYKLNNETRASRGIVLDVFSDDCKKVRYDLKSERGTMRLTLTSDPDVKEIYPVVAVRTAVGIPLRRSDGEVIWRSSGKVPTNTTIDTGARVTDLQGVRLFFEDDEYYNLYRFIHPLRRRN